MSFTQFLEVADLQAPPKSALRKVTHASPPRSPSSSLSGLEKFVPPHRISPLSQTSFLLPPSPTTPSSPLGCSGLNKPLPATPVTGTSTPRPPSSIYSQIDETVKIIESYGRAEDERSVASAPTPAHIQNNYFPDQGQKGQRPESLTHRAHSDQYVRRLEKPPLSSASASIHSTSLVVPSQSPLPSQTVRTSTSASRPKFAKPAYKASKSPRISDININFSFDSIPYDATYGHFRAPISPRITDVVNHSLLPMPLEPKTQSVAPGSLEPTSYDSISRHTGKRKPNISLAAPKSLGETFLDDDYLPGEEFHSHFSRTSSSDSSWVLHNSLGAAFRSYLKKKLHPKDKEEKKRRKERERIMSFASAKYPHMSPCANNTSEVTVSPLRRESQTLHMMYDRMRKFSLSGSSGSHSRKGSTAGPSQPRRREKTRAIPISPYQRYGAKIWEAPAKSKKQTYRKGKTQSKLWSTAPRNQEEEWNEAVRERRISAPLLSQHHVAVTRKKCKDSLKRSSAFQEGSTQLVSAFDRLTMKRNSAQEDEKRRAKLKASIRLLGPSDQFADGRVNY
jgi:hypothetical protein